MKILQWYKEFDLVKSKIEAQCITFRLLLSTSRNQ
jgi:hypothetical protein